MGLSSPFALVLIAPACLVERLMKQTIPTMVNKNGRRRSANIVIDIRRLPARPYGGQERALGIPMFVGFLHALSLGATAPTCTCASSSCTISYSPPSAMDLHYVELARPTATDRPFAIETTQRFPVTLGGLHPGTKYSAAVRSHPSQFQHCIVVVVLCGQFAAKCPV